MSLAGYFRFRRVYLLQKSKAIVSGAIMLHRVKLRLGWIAGEVHQRMARASSLWFCSESTASLDDGVVIKAEPVSWRRRILGLRQSSDDCEDAGSLHRPYREAEFLSKESSGLSIGFGSVG